MIERIIALLLLFIVSPFILLFWLIIKITSPGPFVFAQKRAGKNSLPFYIYKIRTMYLNSEKMQEKYSKFNEADGPAFKIFDDPRLTPIGRILSRTGLDEILQFINIVKGEMSFVGPRPLPVEEAKKIPGKFKLRFSVKPGITSLWIVRGAHKLTFSQWMASDLEYIKKKSFNLNMYIIVMTIKLILQWTGKEIKDYFSYKSS